MAPATWTFALPGFVVEEAIPLDGQAVRLQLTVRRFRCMSARCERATFAEPLPDLTLKHAQRAERFTRSVRSIGLALGGELANALRSAASAGERRRAPADHARLQACLGQLAPTIVDPSAPTLRRAAWRSTQAEAERQSRLARFEHVRALRQQGMPVKRIAKTLQTSRVTVRTYLKAGAY